MHERKLTFIVAALGAFLIFQTQFTFAQTRVHSRNEHAWFMYFGNHKISERFGLHLEGQLRRANFVTDPQQLLLRGGVDYYFKNQNRFTFGYAFVRTFPYGDFPVPQSFPEHRVWQQFLTTQTFGQTKLSHRYRLEQRFIGNASTGEMSGGRYENRARYMLKATHALTKDWKKPLFVAAYDEIFINFGKDVAFNIFDQNRLYGAVGVSASKTLKIELGYLYQLVQLRSLSDVNGTMRNRIEDNHTLQVALFSTLAFNKTE
jgi:hypothetical protein